ncbi:hypothetical protein GRF29_112g746355 [Pseudopithomyces chartarum]|uniref:Uncharacterized protein n=1 Tax=Pseudopithomyces chartarum TaxID=1892770 RepID=A0AAN6LSI8_9PLEO|nr:hypothetical protein GRF29_112g746355 [Pseudopithomyces chartarum]
MAHPSYINVGFSNYGRSGPPELLQTSKYRKPTWFQDGVRKRPKDGKPFYHLVWPKDKKMNMFGRLKDIIQGKGPDIHLAYSARKKDYATNRPLHGRWSGWEHLDRRMRPGPKMWAGQYELEGPFWVNNTSLGGRHPAMFYNFATRKYEPYHHKMWTDAIWQGPYEKIMPDQYRTVRGTWRQDRNWNPSAPGQTVS